VPLTLPTVGEIMTLRRIPGGVRHRHREDDRQYSRPSVRGEGTVSDSHRRRRATTTRPRPRRLGADSDGPEQGSRRAGCERRFVQGADTKATRANATREAIRTLGDWRQYYDAVRVVRAGELEGRKISFRRWRCRSGVPLIRSAVSPPCRPGCIASR
jgi:hypothetical protein